MQPARYLSRMVKHLGSRSSAVSIWMRELRDVLIQTDRLRFRNNLERIGFAAGYEISKTLPHQKAAVQTPLGIADCYVPKAEPVIATILRAGMPVHQGLLQCFDQADSAFVASYRKHHADGSFEISSHYTTCPDLNDRPLIIADPMLATGASLVLAIDSLLENGTPTAIHIVVAIATREGIERVERKYPEVTIWAGDIDDELTAKSYIVPGLGDAGDLAFGPKRQH